MGPTRFASAQTENVVRPGIKRRWNLPRGGSRVHPASLDLRCLLLRPSPIVSSWNRQLHADAEMGRSKRTGHQAVLFLSEMAREHIPSDGPPIELSVSVRSPYGRVFRARCYLYIDAGHALRDPFGLVPDVGDSGD
jgi:hypothetical protein